MGSSPAIERARRFAQHAFLVLASVLASLLLLEGAMAVAWPQDRSGTWREATATGLLVNRSSGEARHQFGERIVRYRFASPHLRAPAPDGALRVLVLGDSFTFGWLLDDGDTFIGRLQAGLDDRYGSGAVALLNAAAGGWGTADQVAFVEGFGPALAPDVIWVVVNFIDIERALASPLWRFDEPSRQLTPVAIAPGRLKAVANALPGYQWLLERSHLLQLTRRAVLLPRGEPTDGQPAAVAPAPDDTARGRTLGAALFGRLAGWAAARNVVLMVTTAGWQEPGRPGPTAAFLADAPALFAELGVPFFDPSPDVWAVRGRAPDQYVLADAGHPSEAGAALIASHLAPFVESVLGEACRQAPRCAALADRPTSR